MLFPEEKKVFYNINPQEKLTICSAFSRRALPLPLSAKNPCRETHPPAPAFNNPPAPPPSPERDPHGGGEGSRIKEKVGKGPGRKEGGKETEREETEERNEKDRTGRKRQGEACRRPGKAIKKVLPRKPVPFPGKDLAGEDF